MEDVRELQADMDSVLNNFSGRKVLWRFLNFCEYGSQPYRNNSEATAFMCGKLEVGVWLTRSMEDARPGSVAALMTEMGGLASGTNRSND